MTPEELISEARRMSRPAVLLIAKGNDYAAIWKGTGVVAPPEGEWEHWVSIDTRFLPKNPGNRHGVVSVYLCTESSDRFHEVAARHDPEATLPTATNGQRLFAKPIECLPPTEAICKFGSKSIQDWLLANIADPNQVNDRESFDEESRGTLEAYDEVLRAEHPLHNDTDCFAMLGGWSACFTWCYGYDEIYPWHVFEKELVVLTIADSEPWIEVFDDGSEFETFSRIT